MITETEIRQARTGSRMLSVLSPGEVRAAVHMAVRSLLVMSGFTVADDLDSNAERIAEAITPKIRTRFPGMCAAEVTLAIESGAAGEWGRDTRPTPANCLRWLDAYSQSEPRKNVMLGLSRSRGPRPEELMTPEMRAEANERAERESALRAWEDYKREGRLDIVTNGFAAMVCDRLMRAGVLRPTAEAVEQAYRASRLRKAQAARFGSVAEMFRIVGKAQDTDGMMDWDCKRELLSMYFGHLRAKGADLRL